MTAPDTPPDTYGPMPELGTMLFCWFCHMAVTLQQADSGWHYWVAAKDPVNGRHHCHGGQPSRHSKDSVVLTLHLPAPVMDEEGNVTGERWYHRYTPEGEGRFA